MEKKAAKLKEALVVVHPADGVPRRKKFAMSAEAKAKIARRQKARWKAMKSKKTATPESAYAIKHG